jgi:hypothetical protein
MSVSNDDALQKGFACDRIEHANDSDEMTAHPIIEAERQLSISELASVSQPPSPMVLT